MIVTDGGGGGGGAIIAVVLLIAVLVVLFLLFGRDLLSGDDATDINADIKIDTPATRTSCSARLPAKCARARRVRLSRAQRSVAMRSQRWRAHSSISASAARSARPPRSA